MFSTLAIMFPAGAEWLVILALGLLIFGKRLPSVGKGIGEGIRNFKKGLKGGEEEAETEAAQLENQKAEAARLPNQAASNSAPAAAEQPSYKFDPYTGKPVQ
jgi:sec-independent protein translocase protein TatA